MKKLIMTITMIALLLPSLSLAGSAKDKAENKEAEALTESTMLVIASAYAGIGLATDCNSTQPSIVVFALGALYYIYAEIKNWNDYKEASDKLQEMPEEYDVTKVQVQIETFQKAEEQTREAAEAARRRASNTASAGAIFNAAAIIALIEFIMSLYSYDDSCSIQRDLKNPFDSLFELILPKLHAEVDTSEARAMGIISPKAVAALSSATTGLNAIFSSAQSSGLVRSILFGGFGILANQVAKKNEEAAEIYDEHADKFANLKNRLIRKLKTGNLKPGEIKEFEKSFSVTKLKNNEEEAKNCAVGNSSFNYQIDKKCKCKDKGSCKKVSMPELKVANFQIPSLMTSSLSDFSSMANSSFASDQPNVKLNQDNLLKKATRLNKFKKDLQAVTNDTLKQSGQNQVDFSGQERLMGQEIISQIRKGLTDEGKSFLNSRFRLPINLAGSEKSSKKSIKEELKNLPTPQSFRSGRANVKNPLEDFLFLAEKENQEALDTSEELSKYQSSEGQVRKEKESSIFEIITIRYLKSAFPRLLEEKKEQK